MSTSHSLKIIQLCSFTTYHPLKTKEFFIQVSLVLIFMNVFQDFQDPYLPRVTLVLTPMFLRLLVSLALNLGKVLYGLFSLLFLFNDLKEQTHWV